MESSIETLIKMMESSIETVIKENIIVSIDLTIFLFTFHRIPYNNQK